MEDDPAIDPGDEVPGPQVGLARWAVLPDSLHADPEPLLSPADGQPGHDGPPVLHVPPPRAGEAPGRVRRVPVQAEIELVRSSLSSLSSLSHTTLQSVSHLRMFPSQ